MRAGGQGRWALIFGGRNWARSLGGLGQFDARHLKLEKGKKATTLLLHRHCPAFFLSLCRLVAFFFYFFTSSFNIRAKGDGQPVEIAFGTLGLLFTTYVI